MDRKDRQEHYRKLGENEGRLDYLFKNKWTTVEERAKKAAITMGITAYRKYFIAGYITSAMKGATDENKR